MLQTVVTNPLYHDRFRSPAFFYGTWGHRWTTSVMDFDTKEIVQKVGDRIPCKYQTREEVIEILKELYDRTCKKNPFVKYPAFEDCIRKEETIVSSEGGKLDGEGLFINMIPIR